MPASNLRWLDTPVSFGAEFQLDSGALVQLTTSRYGTGTVWFSLRGAGSSEWPLPAITDEKWWVPSVWARKQRFRDMVRTFMHEYDHTHAMETSSR